jgi:hypothetical protein
MDRLFGTARVGTKPTWAVLPPEKEDKTKTNIAEKHYYKTNGLEFKP